MKRVFPWIFVLITLSLFGIIIIQVNWIRNAIVIKKEQHHKLMTDVTKEVGDELINGAPLLQSSPNGKNSQGWNMLSDQLSPFLRRNIPVSAKYTTDEVNNIIKKAFKRHDLESPYEFAIVSNFGMINQYQLASDRFFNMLEDSVDAKRYVYLLSGDPSTFQNETFVLIVPSPSKLFVLHSLGWMIGGSILFTLIIIAAFGLTIYTMLRQKKLSEIKSDFINNMTHEFKTPLATISLAVDALGNKKVINDQEKIGYFSGIIKQENMRMNKQVETILQSAILERKEIGLRPAEVNVHEVLEKNMENLQLQLLHKNGRFEKRLAATQPIIIADEVHFSNIISNLLDNALKYSKEQESPLIVVETHNTKKGIQISIQDNGIGMSKETLSRIFEKFYRAHTGNLHNVKGFGLGLAYVKAIVDEHKGKIKVESTPGKGTKFILELPQQTEKKDMVNHIDNKVTSERA